jgi:hypothetical protein
MHIPCCYGNLPYRKKKVTVEAAESNALPCGRVVRTLFFQNIFNVNTFETFFILTNIVPKIAV